MGKILFQVVIRDSFLAGTSFSSISSHLHTSIKSAIQKESNMHKNCHSNGINLSPTPIMPYRLTGHTHLSHTPASVTVTLSCTCSQQPRHAHLLGQPILFFLTQYRTAS